MRGDPLRVSSKGGHNIPNLFPTTTGVRLSNTPVSERIPPERAVLLMRVHVIAVSLISYTEPDSVVKRSTMLTPLGISASASVTLPRSFGLCTRGSTTSKHTFHRFSHAQRPRGTTYALLLCVSRSEARYRAHQQHSYLPSGLVNPCDYIRSPVPHTSHLSMMYVTTPIYLTRKRQARVRDSLPSGG